MVDMNAEINSCINFLGFWFLWIGTAVVAMGPVVFVAALFIDRDYRIKWKCRVISAYLWLKGMKHV